MQNLNIWIRIIFTLLLFVPLFNLSFSLYLFTILLELFSSLCWPLFLDIFLLFASVLHQLLPAFVVQLLIFLQLVFLPDYSTYPFFYILPLLPLIFTSFMHLNCFPFCISSVLFTCVFSLSFFLCITVFRCPSDGKPECLCLHR